MYKANLNLDSPLGTISSIEHVLRSLDRRAEDERLEIARREKTLADYQGQLNRTFDHDERLKELLEKQTGLNKLLDLDKSDAQAIAETPEQPKEAAQAAPVPFDDPTPTPNIFTHAEAPVAVQTLSLALGQRPVRSAFIEPV